MQLFFPLLHTGPSRHNQWTLPTLYRMVTRYLVVNQLLGEADNLHISTIKNVWSQKSMTLYIFIFSTWIYSPVPRGTAGLISFISRVAG